MTTPKKVNDLADDMPGVGPLTADQQTLLKAIFHAGAVAELQAAGYHPDTRTAKVDPGSWRIGLLPDDDGEDEPGTPDPGGGGLGPTDPGPGPADDPPR